MDCLLLTQSPRRWSLTPRRHTECPPSNPVALWHPPPLRSPLRPQMLQPMQQGPFNRRYTSPAPPRHTHHVLISTPPPPPSPRQRLSTIPHSLSTRRRTHIPSSLFSQSRDEHRCPKCWCRLVGQRYPKCFRQVSRFCAEDQDKQEEALTRVRHNHGALGIFTRTGSTITLFGASEYSAFHSEILSNPPQPPWASPTPLSPPLPPTSERFVSFFAFHP